MSIHRPKSSPRGEGAGFTLVELAVVIAVIGVLAAFGVPRLVRSVERAKAVEAFDYLASIRRAQERFQARHGTYAARVSDLDTRALPPRDFRIPATFVPAITGISLRDSWSLTLTRVGATGGFGAYSVTFTEAGYDEVNSTIAEEPANSAINPTVR